MPADHGTPTGGDERRAEIILKKAGAALADAVMGLDSYAVSSQLAPLERSERAQRALAEWYAALDRVRDARNDDEEWAPIGLRKAYIEADMAELVRVAEDGRYSNEFVGTMLRAKLNAPRSPQGEEHEHTWSRLNDRRWCTSCGADGGPWPQGPDLWQASGDPSGETHLSPQGEGHEAGIEALTTELQALVDWFNDAPFPRAERLLYDLSRVSAPPPERDTEKLVEALHRIIDEFDVTDDDPVLTIARDALARDAT